MTLLGKHMIPVFSAPLRANPIGPFSVARGDALGFGNAE